MANRVCVWGVGSYEKKTATAAAEAEKSFIAKKASSVEHKKYCSKKIFFVRISHTVSGK
jgi:hypothetical protein